MTRILWTDDDGELHANVLELRTWAAVIVGMIEVSVMPMKPARLCSAPGCGNPAASGSRCTVHAREAWNADESRRLRGSKLQGARRRLFAASPLCVLCLEAGRTTLAVIRDHKIPIMEGGTEDASNIQALCLECSNTKTREESKRGIRRSAGLEV